MLKTSLILDSDFEDFCWFKPRPLIFLSIKQLCDFLYFVGKCMNEYWDRSGGWGRGQNFFGSVKKIKVSSNMELLPVWTISRGRIAQPWSNYNPVWLVGASLDKAAFILRLGSSV